MKRGGGNILSSSSSSSSFFGNVVESLLSQILQQTGAGATLGFLSMGEMGTLRIVCSALKDEVATQPKSYHNFDTVVQNLLKPDAPSASAKANLLLDMVVSSNRDFTDTPPSPPKLAGSSAPAPGSFTLYTGELDSEVHAMFVNAFFTESQNMGMQRNIANGETEVLIKYLDALELYVEWLQHAKNNGVAEFKAVMDKATSLYKWRDDLERSFPEKYNLSDIYRSKFTHVDNLLVKIFGGEVIDQVKEIDRRMNEEVLTKRREVTGAAACMSPPASPNYQYVQKKRDSFVGVAPPRVRGLGKFYYDSDEGSFSDNPAFP